MKDMFSLKDRVVAVIGSGSGIGQAVAEAVAGQGAHTVCLDVNREAAEATAARIAAAGGQASSLRIDLTDEGDVLDLDRSRCAAALDQEVRDHHLRCG